MINKIFNEDCLIGMQRIPGKSIDMILCDLPYGTTKCKWDVVIPFEPLWEQYKRIIKDNGAIVLFGSQPFTSALVMSNPKWFKYEWIWEKDKCSNFMLAKINPLKAHENILVFGKCKINYYPQKTFGHKKANYTAARSVNKSELYNITPIGKHGHTDRYPRSVQKFNTHNSAHKQLHPTQKPVPLLEYLIKTYTNEGETVLDNTCGSGSTCVAAINTNRNYIGFELDKTYFDIAQKRIQDAQTLFSKHGA